MIKNLKIQILAMILFVLVLPFSFVFAFSNLNEDDINTQTIPENPKPYSNVLIKLSSYSIDLDTALIEWGSGSKDLLSGVGKKEYSFQTLDSNTIIAFTIKITLAETNQTITKIVTIQPGTLDLVWEASDSYTPPFYKGKALPTVEGKIKIVAIPDTSSLPGKTISNINYTWKSEGNTLQDASGNNRNVLKITNDQLRDVEKISASASSIDRRYVASNKTNISIYSPQMIFYKKSPTDGILYNQALPKEATMPEEEMTLVAEPYFLSLAGHEDNFSYKWQINGNDIATPNKKTEITVRPSSRGGYATVNLLIEDAVRLFQAVGGGINITI